MTREENIEILSMLKDAWEMLDGTPDERKAAGWSANALGVAISALRGPTREQVEKMRGKFFRAGIDDVAQDTWRCSRCLVQEFGDVRGINFCPHCGAPMTDEAVDMLAKRLEEVRDEKG